MLDVGLCSVRGCGITHHAKGFCRGHYHRSREGRALDTVLGVRSDSNRGCDVDGCDRPHRAKGMCELHYKRARRGDPLDAPVRGSLVPPDRKCKYPGCGRKHEGWGFCQPHLARSRNGNLDAPIRVKTTVRLTGYDGTEWISSGNPNASGYVIFYTPCSGSRKYRAEHRIVMENALGRGLVKGEEVHHLNGVRYDNRRENLELWNTSQPSGQRVEDKVAWAKEILALYGKR